MTTNEGPAPGFVNYPDHTIDISPSDRQWTASAGEVVLASSKRALVLEETGYGPVVYFPPEDIVAERLSPIEHLTTCPFKGEAHYFANRDAPAEPPVAWTYTSVYDEVSVIAGYIAFYENRVELVEELPGE